MKKIINPPKNEWSQILERPTQTVDDIEGIVNSIFEDVKANGNKAIKKYSLKFDKVELDDLFVSENEIIEAESLMSNELKDAIKLAKNNIFSFHSAQKTDKVFVEFARSKQKAQELAHLKYLD